MSYSIPYVVLIVFFIVLSIIVQQRRDDKELCLKIDVLGSLVLIVFFAFRSYLFTDWQTYYEEFREATWSDFNDYMPGVDREPLYLILLNVCKSVFGNYFSLQITSSIIFLVLLIRFFSHYSDNLMLAFVVFLAFFGFEITINLIRNSVAMGIFLNAIPYLEKRKPMPYFGFCLLAIGFHYSAVFYVPLYFFINHTINKWAFLFIFCCCVVIFALHIPILTTIIGTLGIADENLQEKLIGYSLASQQLGFGMGFLERLLTAGLVFCYYDRLTQSCKSNSIFINALIIYFILVFVLSDFTEISKRLSFLFVFSYWIIWAQIIKCFHFRNNKILFVSFLFFYSIIKTITTINQPYQAYENILMGNNMSYEKKIFIINHTFKDAKY